MKLSRRFSLLLLAFCLGIGSVPGSLAQTYQGRQLVQAELVADTTAVTPGKPFTVGLLLRMEKGWHTYWQYPGDSGLPTEINLKLPPGWEAGPVQWPIPQRLVEPGDIRIYGYHDEVLLTQQVTPPADLQGESVTLQAEPKWLVCERICIPGDASLSLVLPNGEGAPARKELFERQQRELPQAWPGEETVRANWRRVTKTELELRLQSEALKAHPYVDFYPNPPGASVVGHPERQTGEAGEIVFRIPLEGNDLNQMAGLVVFGASDHEQRNAWRLETGASAPSAAPAGSDSAVTAAVPLSSRQLLRFLVLGFLGGMILNLMPCVLPVISLKIFGFIQQAGQSRARILRSGLAFSAGVFAWFLGLALLLVAMKAAGRDLTWGAFQFTNPYFVLGLGAIVLVFALNLLGVFEITLPESASRGLLGWTNREGEAGSFFQGVFATVLATPCTAPFLGTALGFAFTQSSFVILAMFAAIAAGMSAPYLLLTAQPAWLRFLPKPGPWMVRVKELMGFILLATLLFLLSVLGAQRGAGAIVWSGAFLLVLGLVCWMKGAFLTATVSRTTRIFVTLLMLVLLAAGGFFFIGTKFNAPVAMQEGTPGDGWVAFSPARLASELEKGNAVFLDFTAAWCVTCKFNEATVLESTEVRDAFTRSGIIKMKADWTNADPEITRVLKQFGRPGVPLYVLYPPGQPEQPFIFPELLTKKIVLNQIQNIAPRVASE